MTANVETLPIRYSGTGALTTFAITFTFQSASEIEVWLRDESVSPATQALQASPAQYSVVGTDVVFVAAPAATDVVVIRRKTALNQLLDLLNTGNFNAERVEEALDKVTYILQEFDERMLRSALLPESSAVTDMKFPEPVAGSLLVWNVGEDGFDNTTVDVSSLQTQITQNALDIATNAANIATNTANIATNVTNINTNITNIATNAANILALQGTVAGLAGNVATNAAAIAANSAAIAAFGTGSADLIGMESIINNQAVPYDLPDLMFDGDDYTSVKIDYEIMIRDDSQSRFSTGVLYCQFKDGVWRVERANTIGDFDGVSFDMSTDGANVGTVRYTSENLAGGNYGGCIKYRVKRFEGSPVSNIVTINNGQAVALDIGDLQFNGNADSSVKIDFEMIRKTDTESRFSSGVIYMRYKDMVWEVERAFTVGDFDGVTFDVTNAMPLGTLNYVSDTLGGPNYVGTFKWKIDTFRSTGAD